MAARFSSASMFNWLSFDFSYSSLRSSFLRFPWFMSSSFSYRWTSSGRSASLNWDLRWPDLNFSIFDDVVWSLVTAFESVALVSMLCFFFLFCGCTV